MIHNPQFTVYLGCMWAAKTSKLLTMVDRYKYQNKNVALFKPKIDERYSVNEVSSHTGWKMPATSVANGAELLKHLTECDEIFDVVAVDELFMIPGISDALIFLFKNGINVIVASLDLSHACKPFKEVQKILPYATYIKKCSSVCEVCGRDAFYSYKKAAIETEIEVGGGELYSPRCYEHHPIMNKLK